MINETESLAPTVSVTLITIGPCFPSSEELGVPYIFTFVVLKPAQSGFPIITKLYKSPSGSTTTGV
jgi:hypothetical protein